MVRAVVHRPARATLHLADRPPRTVEAPPTLPDGKTGGAAHALLPVAGLLSSLVMMTVLRGSAFVAVGAVLLVVTALGSLGLLLSQRGQATRQRRQQRERYLDYLEEPARDARRRRARARDGAHVLDPPAAALVDVVRDPARLWERRPAIPTSCGCGSVAGGVPGPRLALDDRGSALTPTDPFMLAEARAVVRRFGAAGTCPLVVPLANAASVSVVGDRDGVLRAARALVAQLAVVPRARRRATRVAFGADRLVEWEWLKWLPHVRRRRPRRRPASRRIAPDPSEPRRRARRGARAPARPASPSGNAVRRTARRVPAG